MIDIPLDVDVQCTDGPCGRSTYVILNPVTCGVTHFVVRRRAFPYEEYLVPIQLIAESTPERISLNCAQHKLATLEPFIEVHFVTRDAFELEGPYDAYVGYMMWPYVLPEDVPLPIEYERVPPGELALRRGTRVDATDGHVGRVDEFLIDPATGHITHMVLREGHLWGQKDVTIPVSEIDRIEEDTVHLKLGRQGIADLPVIPIRRRLPRPGPGTGEHSE